MKNKAIQLMIAKQYNVKEEDVTVEFIASIDRKYEFRVKVADEKDSIETMQLTVETKPWVNDPFIM